MTSRRKKTKLIEQALRLLIVVVFFPVYYLTNSYTLAAISSEVVLGIVLAIALIRKKEDENRLKNSGITDIDKMKGTQFTTYLKTLFERLGYAVEMIKARGNYGAIWYSKKMARRLSYKPNGTAEMFQWMSSRKWKQPSPIMEPTKPRLLAIRIIHNQHMI